MTLCSWVIQVSTIHRAARRSLKNAFKNVLSVLYTFLTEKAKPGQGRGIYLSICRLELGKDESRRESRGSSCLERSCRARCREACAHAGRSADQTPFLRLKNGLHGLAF